MQDTNKDHPDQVIDTDLPDEDTIDYEAWETMRDMALREEEQ